MKIITASRQIGRTFKNAARLRTIVGVFAKHGFHNIAERVKLGRFLIERLTASADLEKLSTPERIRCCFEELGPTFVKLGQVLASRPDLVPEDFVLEFSKLQDRVQPLPFEKIKEVIETEFQKKVAEFQSFETLPVGSASIAQVHRAKLISGENVVVKIQRPGIIQTINDDLNVLYFLGELLEKYIPESRAFNPVGIVDEFFKTLELETNFVVEANNLRRFAINFAQDPNIRIPKVYPQLTTEKVLTMEAFPGLPLSSYKLDDQNEFDPDQILRIGLRAYLKMVFKDGVFHGDLHAGNFFVLPQNQIGLIDFGVVGRLNRTTQVTVANMIIALAKEDYQTLAYEYIELAPYSEVVDVNHFAKELRDLIAPYYGLSLGEVNLGKVLMSSAAIATKLNLVVPTELMLFFKSLVSIEGLARKIKSDFDFLTYSLEFAEELVKIQYDPNRLLGDFNRLAKESRDVLFQLPRYFSFLLRKWTSPHYVMKFRLTELDELRKSIEVSFNLMFLGIIIGCLVLSSSIIVVHPSNQNIAGIPTLSFIGYMTAAGLGIIAFFNYIKK